MFFIINTFGVKKIKKEIHLPNLIKEHLDKVYAHIVKYTPMFNPFQNVNFFHPDRQIMHKNVQ